MDNLGTMSIEVMTAYCRMIAQGDLKVLGKAHVSAQDWELLRQDEHWSALDRDQVMNSLRKLIHHGVTGVGLPAIRVPAEYTAVFIALIARPCNIPIACRWSETALSAADIANGVDEHQYSLQAVTAEQMLALVGQFLVTGAAMVASFDNKVSAWIAAQAKGMADTQP